MVKSLPQQSKACPGIPELCLDQHQQLPTFSITMRTEIPKIPSTTTTPGLGEQDTKAHDQEATGWDSNPKYPQPSSRLISNLPAREIYLITTKVEKEVWEHSADLLEQTGHKLVGAVNNGVDGPIDSRRSLAHIAGSQEAWST